MNDALRSIFFRVVVRPVVYLFLGVNVRHSERLPRRGPAIIVANHNSHLDTIVLMCLFPMRMLRLLRPVAAADYFLRRRLLAWFSLEIMGIIPIDRRVRASHDPLETSVEALDRGEILILFPEGSRGEPEVLNEFKAGVAHLVKRRPAVPVIPVYLHGLGKSLPRGEALLVPFICDAFVGEPLTWQGNKEQFMHELNDRMTALAAEGAFPAWE